MDLSPIVVAAAAADYVSGLIQDYQILIGLNQIALIHVPTGNFVEVYNSENTTIDTERAPSLSVPVAQIMLDLLKHNLDTNHHH